jgi:hypothetical protein
MPKLIEVKKPSDTKVVLEFTGEEVKYIAALTGNMHLDDLTPLGSHINNGIFERLDIIAEEHLGGTDLEDYARVGNTLRIR